MKPRRGFTLIELILAMAIAAGLALSLYTAMSTLWRAQQTAAAAVAPLREGAIAMDIIANDFANIPPAAPDPTTADTLTLEGPFEGIHQGGDGSNSTDDVQFRTFAHDEPTNDNDPLTDGMRGIEYTLLADGSTQSLVRRVTRNLLATVQENPVDEVICRNVKSFAMQYYDGTDWQTEWDSTQVGDVLPMAVQITIDVNNPPKQNSNADPGVHEITRVIALACAKPGTGTGLDSSMGLSQ